MKTVSQLMENQFKKLEERYVADSGFIDRYFNGLTDFALDNTLGFLDSKGLLDEYFKSVKSGKRY
jgi:hypothetical protein